MSYFEDFTGKGELSRRTFVRGVTAAALVGAAGAVLTACGAQQTANNASSGDAAQNNSAAGESAEANSAAAETSTENTEATATTAGGKTLVAYFSGQGHTQRAAEALADALGADIFVITPAEPYSTEDLNYNDDSSRVVREYQNEDERDTPLEQNAPDNFADYDTVFVGYPIWWGDSAWAMHRFASENDFTGKTVYPFCTSYSSGLGASGTNLAELAGTGEWQEGRRFDQGVDASEVQQWAQSLQA